MGREMKNKWIVGLMFLLLASNCSAGVGSITEQDANPGTIKRSNQSLEGKKGTGVEMADSISTTKGKLGIVFQDETKVQINEGSRLVIDDFVYDPKNKGAGKLALNMASGTVRYASGAIAHNNPNKVAINTPTATVAVRGTDFTATVDELGQSTIILLPSCREGYKTVKNDCKVGIIDVITDAGLVTLDQAFQATVVTSRSLPPAKPVTLKLTEDAISNILILAPPVELKKDSVTQKARVGGFNALDQDFLKENQLVNSLDKQQASFYEDRLKRNPLDADLLPNLLDIITAQISAANSNLLAISSNQLLPDYKPATGVVATVDTLSVELSRDDGSNVQSVHVDRSRALTIYQVQGSVEVKNRVNTGGTTTITLKQN